MYEYTSTQAFIRLTLCVAALAVATAGHAQSRDSGNGKAEEKKYRAELSAGLQHSSRLSVDELDVVADNGDLATLLGFELGYEFGITKKTEFDISYSFSQTIYEELDQFNLRTHFGVADLSQDFGKIDVGLSFRYLDAGLDGSGFMEYRQAAPYLTALLGKRVFVRAEYGHAEKRFDTDSVRDADVDSFGSDWFLFLGSPRTYVLLGYRLDQHDAISTEHVYDQDNLKLHFIKRFNVFGNSAKFNIGYRYETRDYQFVTQSIGGTRKDERRKLRASLELPLTGRLGTEIRYEVRDYESNLPEADRDEQIGSIEFVAKF